MTTLTAKQMQSKMGRGINLGLFFEQKAHATDPAHVNPLIKAYKDRGFTHLRIPATFYGDSPSYCMLDNAQWSRDLQSAVRYATSLGMIVILNTHHERWLYRTYADTSAQNVIFSRLWKRIASLFKDIPASLLCFEVLNELQGVFDSSVTLTRRINQVGLAAIHSVSPDRIVLFQPNQMGNLFAAPKCWPTRDSLPASDKVMVTVHSYDPWDLCGQESTATATNAQIDADVTKYITLLKAWSDKVGVPVHVGECGIGRRDQSKRDAEWVRHYYWAWGQVPKVKGIPVCTWEDAGWYALRDAQNRWIYGLLPAFMSA